MTTKKVSRRAAPGAKKHQLQIETVKITSLKHYPGNARRGAVAEIAKSLKENGQFRPLVVQKSTNYVLAGNHTLLAAKQLNWKEVQVTYVDVDDDAARKIVLADNRTNDLATMDMAALAKLIEQVEDPEGTGYSADDMALILSASDEAAEEMVELSGALDAQAAEDDYFNDSDDGEIGSEEDNRVTGSPLTPDTPAGGEADQFSDTSEELSGVLQLDPTIEFDGVGYWRIPRLRTDQMMTKDDLPDNLLAWAGTATKDNSDPDQWWLYNYGADSTSGMQQPISQCIVSFYAWDEYFERWWEHPDRYVAKMLNGRMKYAIMPDFSQWTDDPRVISLYALYKSFWLARFMQEAGIKVAPNLSWRFKDDSYLDEVVLKVQPKNPPLLSMQMQTFDHKMSPADRKWLIDAIKKALTTIGPDHLLLYGGTAAQEFFDKIKVHDIVPITFIEHRMSALAEKAKQRERKKTL